MRRQRHHVVSRGFQRFFAEGERVLLIDKAPSTGVPRVRPAGTRDVFVRKDFSSHRSDGQLIDPLEDEWQRIEREALPPIAAWLAGHARPPGWNPVGSREAAKMIAALHFARSYAYLEVHERISLEQGAELAARLPSDHEFVRRWRASRSDDPTPDAVSQLVNEQVTANFRWNSAYSVERMAAHFNFAIEKLGPLHTQEIRPSGSARFVLGDSPFVIADRRRSRIGSRELALGDADLLLLPLSPTLAIAFTGNDEGHGQVGDHVVQRVNAYTWQAAGRQVIAHPDTDLGLALASTGWRGKVGRNDPCPCGSGMKAKRCCVT